MREPPPEASGFAHDAWETPVRALLWCSVRDAVTAALTYLKRVFQRTARQRHLTLRGADVEEHNYPEQNGHESYDLRQGAGFGRLMGGFHQKSLTVFVSVAEPTLSRPGAFGVRNGANYIRPNSSIKR